MSKSSTRTSGWRMSARSQSCPNLPRQDSSTRSAAAASSSLAVLLALAFGHAQADDRCGPAELQFAQTIAAGMQPFAIKVTKTGRFAFKDEYSGDGSQRVAISFADRGKTIFVHRIAGDPNATATAMRPGRTKSGELGFTVALVQGHSGACEFDVFVSGAKFVVAPRGFAR